MSQKARSGIRRGISLLGDRQGLAPGEQPGRNAPVVLVADDAVIGPFLRPTIFTNDPTMPEFGEMYIPWQVFDQVPRHAFQRTTF